MDIFVVYLYCDYRKEVDLQHLKAFKSREEAIDFAKKYAHPEPIEGEYTCIQGSEYDAKFFSPDEDNENYEEMNKKYEEMKKELKVKPGMWYMRIAVDKVKLN